jgi:putative NADPH-quinone reductase
MAKRMLILQGHPDPGGSHFCHGLADAYGKGAAEGGHEVRRIDVARLDFALLRTKEDWETKAPADPIRACQEDIAWAQQLAIFYPLWLGGMPALLKGFLEQVFRPGFAIEKTQGPGMWKRRLQGKSARIVITMGMPALVYRWYFGAHSLKSLERNVLGFCGIGPIRESLVGMVEGPAARRERWLRRMQELGRRGV